MSDGLDQLRAFRDRLKHASRNMDKVSDETLSQVAEDLQVRMLQKVPRRTGALAASIVKIKKADQHYSVGPTLHYGRFVEYGTGQRGEFPNGSAWPGMRSQPYIRPAVKEVQEDLRNRLGKNAVSMIVKGRPSER